MRDLPSGAAFHGRPERTRSNGAIPARSRGGRYRSGLCRQDGHRKIPDTPLRGLWQHAPYFHDGSARDLLAVVNHYDQLFALELTAAQKADLVEFLKSL
jgi:Cytochrome c peroxidase